MMQLPDSPRAFARISPLLSRFALACSVMLLLSGLSRNCAAQSTYTGNGISINSGNGYAATSSITTLNAETVTNVAVTLKNLYVDEGIWYSESLAGTSIVLAFCPTSGTCREFMLLGSTGDAYGEGANDDLGASGINVTIQDGAAKAPGCSTYDESNCPAWQSSPTSQTYEPSSYWKDNALLTSVPSNSQLGLPAPYSTYTLSFPQQDGSQGLDNEFSLSGAGTWTLIIADDTGQTVTPVSISGWSLTLSYASAPSTTTSLSSNNNPSFASSPNNSVNFTATVTSTGGTVSSGTVEFDTNTNSTISGCGAVPVSNGTATCTTSLAEGLTPVSATYTGTGEFANSSSNTLDQVVIEHPTGNISSNHWCTTAGFVIPGGSGVSSIYPSVIQVSGYPDGTTVTDVKVTLNGLYGDVDAQHLLVSPTNKYNLDFFDGSWFNNTLGSGSAVSPVFFDSAGAYPTWGGAPVSGNYEASDQLEAPQLDTFTNSIAASATSSAATPIPQIPGTVIYGYNNQFPAERGASTNTFEYAFNGAPANGDWALYGYQQNDSTGEAVGSWCIDLTIATGNSTTTTVSSGQNPQTAQSSATLTATVKSGSSPVTSGGTVTFLDNGATPLASGGNSSNTPTLQADGTATYSTGSAYYSVYNGTGDTKIYEGDHNFTAEYSGSGSDNPSDSPVFWQRFDNLSTVTVTDNTHYSYCNAGPILTRANTIGAFLPNPSNLFVNDLPGTVDTVSVTLNGLFTTGDTSSDTQSMLAGPTGAALDFFSNNAGGSPLSFSSGDYTFADGGTALPSSEFSPGTYAPKSASSPDTFTASSSGFYNLPPSWGYAAPAGSGTFGNTFGGTLGDGTWSLFFNLSSLSGVTGAQNGWCANFTENAVTATATAGHNGSGTGGAFVQGESNAPITVDVENDGVGGSPGSPGNGTAGDPAGSNANPLTVVDTLPTGLTYVSASGTNWNCNANAQVVTCTNDVASVSAGSNYPTLTIDVNVGNSVTGSLSNSATVSGAGVVSATSNTDSISVQLPTTTAASSTSTMFSTNSQSITLSATVTSNSSPVNEGSVTFDIYDQSHNLVGTPVTSTTVSNGVFSAGYMLPASQAGGVYSIHATFNGDSTYALSSDTTATLTIDFAAALTSPAPNSVLAGNQAVFTWSAGSGATSYIFMLGTKVGKNDIRGTGDITATSVTFSPLPTNGETIYARLYTNFASSRTYTDYVFTAASGATLTSPANNSTLTGSQVTFNWTAPTGATGYILRLGTSPGANDIRGSGNLTGNSITFSPLPTNGETIYARLYTLFTGTAAYNDYVFTAANEAQATLISPAPNSTLPSSNVTFSWTPGSGAISYTLWLGTTPGGDDIRGTTTTSTSINYAPLPTNGETIYVRLFTNYASGRDYTDYMVTAAP